MNNRKSSNTKNRVTVDRSAATGRFVTPGYTKRNPSTTEVERYRRKK